MIFELVSDAPFLRFLSLDFSSSILWNCKIGLPYLSKVKGTLTCLCLSNFVSKGNTSLFY